MEPRTAARKHRQEIWPAFYVLGFFLLTGALFSLLLSRPFNLYVLGLIGLSIMSGFLIYARAPRKKKDRGRKISLALVGLGLFLGAGIFGRESFQIEGFFFFVLAGVFGGPVVHYLTAKLVGPFLIGRGWCSWGCWTWMVLDYLPYKRSPGWRDGLTWIRYAHFGLSLGLVLVLWFLFGYRHGFEWAATDGLYWFALGNLLYFATGIALTYALKDNRAFCKYVCPITVFLKAGSRFSLLRITGDKDTCNACGACDKLCPMSIPVSMYILAGRPVTDNECVLCQTCISSCPQCCVELGLGWRGGGKPLQRTRVSSPPESIR